MSKQPVRRGTLGVWGLSLLVAALAVALSAPGAGALPSYAWGRNDHGQLGNGTTELTSVPLPMDALGGEVVELAGGEGHGLALLSDGTVMAWGANDHGQLGNGTIGGSSDVPEPVGGLGGVVAVAAGGKQSLALLSDGTVMAWGENLQGQLGDGSNETSAVPVPVSGLSGVKAIAAGAEDSFAVMGDGTVRAWGSGQYGALGDGGTTATNVPVAVSGVTGATAVSAGRQFAVALLEDGEARAWGLNEWGELGDGSKTDSTTAVPVSGLSGAVSIASGYDHTLALLGDGSIMAWGLGNYGQLGDGETTPYHHRTLPYPVGGLSGVRTISAGGFDSLAALADGEVMAWGEDVYGQLGNGAFGVGERFGTPERVCGIENPLAIASGYYFQFAYGAPTLPSCPVVTGLLPDVGSVLGGTTVTIYGAHFTGATAVAFGEAPATSFTVNSDSSITAVAPPGAGVVDVRVTANGYESHTNNPDRYTYVEPPEFGRCLKVTSGTGTFAKATCTAVGGERKWDWYPGFGGLSPLLKNRFHTRMAAFTETALTTTGERRISCSGQVGGGEYSGPRALANVWMKLTGCTGLGGGACTSAGLAEGEVATSTLSGQIGVLQTGKEGPQQDKLGVDLAPAPETAFAEFACGATPVKLTGSVIVQMQANGMLAQQTLKFQQSKGIQKPSRFEGGPEAFLEAQIGETRERIGLTLSSLLQNEEKVELNSVA